MLRKTLVVAAVAALSFAASPTFAEGLDDLKGQFAFDWHIGADKTSCAAVGDELLALFKSDKYTCSLEVITNTASEEPARVCSENGDGAEYLIFATKESCESERETQASNAE